MPDFQILLKKLSKFFKKIDPQKDPKMTENGKQFFETPQNFGPHDQQGYGK